MVQTLRAYHDEPCTNHDQQHYWYIRELSKVAGIWSVSQYVTTRCIHHTGHATHVRIHNCWQRVGRDDTLAVVLHQFYRSVQIFWQGTEIFSYTNPICGTFSCVLEMSSLPIILDTKKLGCRDENILPETPSPPPMGMGCDATLV